MIGHKLILNKTINLHELGVVEVTEFEKLSSTTYYKDVAERPRRYQKRHFRTKTVTVQVRVIEEKRENSKDKIDEIVGLSYSDSPIEFYLDDKKWCMAILESADSSLYFRTGLLELEFTNVYGYWLGEEKTSIGAINSNSIIDSTHITIEFTAMEKNVSIKNTTQDEELKLTELLPYSNYRIDNYDKTAKHVLSNGNTLPAELDLSSDFIKLLKGYNYISVTGASGVSIKYREVVSL